MVKKTMTWLFRLTAIAMATVATAFILVVAHDEVEYRLGWYPDLDCNPPGLDKAMITAAFSFAAENVLGLENARFDVVGFDRYDVSDWPAFVGSVELLDQPVQFWMSGNGCGLEFEKVTSDPASNLRINVSLPRLALFSVRKGLEPVSYF